MQPATGIPGSQQRQTQAVQISSEPAQQHSGRWAADIACRTCQPWARGRSGPRSKADSSVSHMICPRSNGSGQPRATKTKPLRHLQHLPAMKLCLLASALLLLCLSAVQAQDCNPKVWS